MNLRRHLHGRFSLPSSSKGVSSKILLGLTILIAVWIPSPCLAAGEPCQVCGCDGCTGDQYDNIGNPSGVLPIPPNLQNGMLEDATELQCFWLPYMEIFLGGLDFCTDDALRLQQEFREICGCAELPDGVKAKPGSLEEFLETLVDNPTCNVCGSDTTVHLSKDAEDSTFTVPIDALEIFPASLIDNAARNPDGSALVSCQTAELAGWHHHFSEATCSAIHQLKEFQDGCECQAIVKEQDQGSCDLCGCEDCPPFLFHMTNPAGAIAIPEEFHSEAYGLTEMHCWMIEFGNQGGAVPDEECRTFQRSDLFREACGCPPIPEKSDQSVKEEDEASSATNRQQKNTAGAAFAAVLGVSAAAILAFVLYRNKRVKKSTAEPTSDGLTLDESVDSTASPSNENAYI